MSGVPVLPPEPQAPPIGFRTVANTLRGPDGQELSHSEWMRGISYTPRSCAYPVQGAAQCVSPDLDPTARELDGAVPVDVWPFTIEVPVWCRDQVTPQVAADLDSEARAALEANTSAALAAELWTGNIRITNPNDNIAPAPHSLSRTTPALQEVTAPPNTTMAGLWSLILQIRWDGSLALDQFVVHVPPSLIPPMLKDGHIAQVGNRYVGPFGTPILTDAGYQGFATQGPQGDAAAAGSVWVFVTGPVRYAVSDIRFSPDNADLRRANPRMNRYEVWAQRDAIVDFDACGAFAVEVPVPIAGAVGQ